MPIHEDGSYELCPHHARPLRFLARRSRSSRRHAPSQWHAHYDLRPPGPHKLHLSADCTFPTSGYHVVLKPGKKGTDPDTRVLKRVAHKPEGMVMQVITTIPLAYTEQTDHSYKKVKILPDGPTLDVEEVH